MESIPLTQVRDGVDSLLTMDVSDDLMPLRLQAGEKPAVPLGADDLVTFYEKQLAATQLVQHRLQKQFNQLTEDKLALETSLSVQTAALQQQLAVARECAERALVQAKHAQQQVQEAHTTVGEIVGAVTHLAELLDVSGATQELTHSFEAVAHSTQRTFQTVAAAQEGTQTLLELQLEARDACQVSPLLGAVSVGSPRAMNAMLSLEEETVRLRSELEEAKRREQDLEAEMQAAQVLFKGLEAEVVSLQHDQAQAAAKLQVSQEELAAARDQLLVARQSLPAPDSVAGDALTQGLEKLDAHFASIGSFLESLAMPQPPTLADSAPGGPLQLCGDRSDDGNATACSLAASDDQLVNPSSTHSARHQNTSPRQAFRQLTVRVSCDGRQGPHISEAPNTGEATGHCPDGVEELTFRLRHQLNTGQDKRSQQLQARQSVELSLEAERGTRCDKKEQRSPPSTGATVERDLLRNRVGELESYVVRLEAEKERLLRGRAQQISLAAAAGAAGAAAAVAVVSDGPALVSSPPSRASSVVGASAQPFAAAGARTDAASARAVLNQFMSEASAMAAERDATMQRAQRMDRAVQRAERLEEQLGALGDLLQQGVAGHDGALQELESVAAKHGLIGRQLPGEKMMPSGRLRVATPGAVPSAAALSTAVDLASRATSEAGLAQDAMLAGSPPLHASGPRPSRSRSRRSDTSGSRPPDEDVLSEPGDSVAEMLRGYARSSVALQSSYQSFTSEAPLVPTRRYTDASEPPTYLLDPTEPLEELLPVAGVHSTSSAMLHHGGDGLRDAARQLRNSAGSADTSGLMAEVQDLRAAVCSLLVSKIITCTELQEESEERLAVLQAEHDAELAQLREEHAVEIYRLQGLLGERSVDARSALGRSDKSTRASDDGPLDGGYEAELLQHTATLEVRIAELEERQQQLVSSYEARLQRVRADHTSQLASLASAMQKPGITEGPDQAGRGRLGGFEHEAGQPLLELAQYDLLMRELRQKHAAELQERNSQLAAQFVEHNSQLEADTAAEIARLQARHSEEKAQLQAAYAEELAQLQLALNGLQQSRDADREGYSSETTALRTEVTELREQLAGLNAELHELRASYNSRLSEDLDHHHAEVEELRRNLEDREGDLMLRESLISELRGQLQQLQSEKEVEEQSLQSLLSTKSWMTDEIRSLQAGLKEATAKLALVEPELAAMKAAATNRLSSPSAAKGNSAQCVHMGGDGESAAPVRVDGTSLRGSCASAASQRSDEVGMDFGVAVAADQLAEAAMQAALAEVRLEALQLQQTADNLPYDEHGIPAVSMRSPGGMGGQTAEQTDLMMETVVLHGELDELRAKHRLLQAQLDAAADELAYAAMRAALAELQLEELRLQRAEGFSAVGLESPRHDQQKRALHSPYFGRSNYVAASMASFVCTPSKPDESIGDIPNLMGSESFLPIQQARQLYKELRAVGRALGELMSIDVVTETTILRQELSSFWEGITAAQDRAANVVRILQRQKQGYPQTKQSGQDRSLSGEEDGQPLGEPQDGPHDTYSLQSDLERARDAYRDAYKVYEMLRSDAEDINSVLWRWNVKLQQQLSTTEQALMQAQTGSLSGPQHALEALLRKEAYVRSVENQVSELQAGLQTAQSKLLHRDGQVAALQDMFVQLSEQISVFEGAVVRCEVLSADLVNKSEAKWA